MARLVVLLPLLLLLLPLCHCAVAAQHSSNQQFPYVSEHRAVFVRQPNGTLTRVPGASAALHCSATQGIDGAPLPVHDWTRNGTSLGRSESVLLLAELSEADAGLYRCAVRVDEGVVLSGAARLIVRSDTSVRLSLSRLPTRHTLHLVCTASDQVTAVNWMRDDRTIADDGDDQRITSDRAGRDWHLQMEGEPEPGAYACATPDGSVVSQTVVVNATTTVSSTSTRPVPLLVPEEQTVVAGDDAIFHCVLDGVPPNQIRWQRLLPPQAQLPVDRSVVRGGSFLRLRRVSHLDAGTYACAAANRTYSAVLHVALAPKFVMAMRDVTVDRQLVDGRFSCRVEAYPAPDFTWYKDGQPVQSKLDIKIVTQLAASPAGGGSVVTGADENATTEAGEAAVLQLPVHISDLVVHNVVSNEHDGVYQCVARNSAGEASAAAVFKYGRANSEVVDVQLSVRPNHRGGDMEVRWVEPPSQPHSAMQMVKYACVDGERCAEGTRTVNNVALEHVRCNRVNGQCRANCCAASQPQPGVEYAFTLMLYNGRTFQLSDTVTTTTFDARTTQTTPLQLTDLPNNGVRLQWANDEEALAAYVPGKVQSFVVEWRLRDAPDLATSKTLPASHSQFDIPYLSPDKTYQLRVLAVTRAGAPSPVQLQVDRDYKWTAYRVNTADDDDDDNRTQTEHQQPKLPPPSMNAHVLNSSAIEVEWFFADDVDKTRLVRLAGYRIVYNVDVLNEPAKGHRHIELIHDPSKHSVMAKRTAVVGALAPHTHYRVSVMAVDVDGQAGLETAMYLQTKQVLPQPTALQCRPEATAACTIKVNWQSAESAPAVPSLRTRYELRYRVKPPTGAADAYKHFVIMSEQQVLQLATDRCSALFTYGVSVRAVRNMETSPWTDELDCWLRSLGAASSSPQNVSAQVVNTSTIYVKWRPPPNATQINIIGYVVYYKEHSADGTWNTQHVSGDDRSLLLHRLRPAARFLIGVATVTGSGESGRTPAAENPVLLVYAADAAAPNSAAADRRRTIALELVLGGVCLLAVALTCAAGCVLRRRLLKPAAWLHRSPRLVTAGNGNALLTRSSTVDDEMVYQPTTVAAARQSRGCWLLRRARPAADNHMANGEHTMLQVGPVHHVTVNSNSNGGGGDEEQNRLLLQPAASQIELQPLTQQQQQPVVVGMGVVAAAAVRSAHNSGDQCDSKGGPDGARPRGSRLLALSSQQVDPQPPTTSANGNATGVLGLDTSSVTSDARRLLPPTKNMADLLIPVRHGGCGAARTGNGEHSSGVEWSSDLSHSPVTASSLHSWSHDDRLSQPGCASLPNLTDSGIGFDSTRRPAVHVNGLHGPYCCCNNNKQSMMMAPPPHTQRGPRNSRPAWPTQRTSS